MTQALLVLAAALTAATVVFGVAVLLTGGRQDMRPAEPDGRAVPLPADRPLAEPDLAQVRFDTAARGYRMAQVDAALQRAAYDVGYKDELIKVLQAEIVALREGRFPDAEVLRRAREAAVAPGPGGLGLVAAGDTGRTDATSEASGVADGHVTVAHLADEGDAGSAVRAGEVGGADGTGEAMSGDAPASERQ